jgi:hypothetical protein
VGRICTDYQRPAIWGVPPNGDDSSQDAISNGGDKENDDVDIDGDVRDVDEEEEEEYDNVELILDESRTAPPPMLPSHGGHGSGISTTARSGGGIDASVPASSAARRGKPMRNLLRRPVFGTRNGDANDANNRDRDVIDDLLDDPARRDVVIGERREDVPPPSRRTAPARPNIATAVDPTAAGGGNSVAAARTASPPEDRDLPIPTPSVPASVPVPAAMAAAKMSGAKKGDDDDDYRDVKAEIINRDVVRPDPPERTDRDGPDATLEEEVEVNDLTLLLSQKNEDNEDRSKKTKKSRMGLLKGLSYKQKPFLKKETLPLSTDGAEPSSTAADGAVTSEGVNESGTAAGDHVDVDNDKGKRRSMSLGRRKKSMEEAPENQSAAKTAGATSGSGADITKANVLKKKMRKSKTDAEDAARDIEDAKNWKSAYDRSCEKHYYYHKDTMAVSWDKPLGYDKAHDVGGKKDTAGAKRNIGLVGRGRKAASAKENKSAHLQGSNAVGTYDQAKYWRETLDSTTNKIYYYNKKTKEVSWTKPKCLEEGMVDAINVDESKVGEGGSGKKKADNGVEVESHLVKMAGSVADKRKKSWFKLGASVERNTKIEPSADKDVVVVDTCLEDVLLPVTEAPVAEVEPALVNAATPDVVDNCGKHWRIASDAITGEPYYFNKKTKAVSWTKPAGFKDKEDQPFPEVDRGVTKTIVMAVATAAAAAAATVATAAAAAAATVATAVQDPAGDGNDGIENAANQQPFTVDDVSAIDGVTESKDSGNHAKVQEDTPFDEPEAPFDEQISRSIARNQKPDIKKVVTLVPHQFIEQEDVDPQEQEDSFDQDGTWPVGLKSNKALDHASRQRTFASHSSASTRKAANTPRNRASYGKSFDRIDDATFDNSLNNSSIASDIFEDNHKIIQESRKAKSKKVGSENILRNSQEKKLPQLLNTPPRILPQAQIPSKSKGDSNRRYTSKRAENLGDSSVDDSTDKDPSLDQYWSSDDNDDDAADDVSALSGIGNESISSKKKKTNVKRGDAGNKKNMQPNSSSREVSSNICEEMNITLMI